MSIAQVIFVCLMGLIVVHGMEKPKSSLSCEEPNTHYLEMGCKPVYNKRNRRCPERYECPATTFNTTDKCYYKSKFYGIGERLPKNVIDHNCVEECICTLHFGTPVFNCANVECPDEFLPPSSGVRCIKQYKKKLCCSHNEICEEDKIKQLKTCEFDGKVYHEGEKFYPKDSCKTCICNDKFDGTLSSSQCQKVNCGVQIFHTDKINQKCAPVYLESRNCCPIYWKCYETNDTIVENDDAGTRTTANTELNCLYGNNTLVIGDEVMSSDKCMTCKCNLPPLVTCVKALNC